MSLDVTMNPEKALRAELARPEYQGLTDERAASRLNEPQAMGIRSNGIPALFSRADQLGWFGGVSAADVAAARSG